MIKTGTSLLAIATSYLLLLINPTPKSTYHSLFISNSLSDNASIAHHLQTLTRRPHIAGSEANTEAAAYVLSVFASCNIPSHFTSYEVGLTYPISRSLVLKNLPPEPPTNFTLRQEIYKGDPYADVTDQVVPTFHAYAKSGTAIGPVVYVNYGREEDYLTLGQIGINVSGTVVLAKYGKIFRGDIVKNAYDAGAAGVVIYSDRKDYGGAGVARWFPDDKWLPPSGVQVGSVFMGKGDPTTPGWASSGECERLSKEKVEKGGDVPLIPSLPVSAADGEKILRSIGGPVAQDDWQGSIDAPTYTTTQCNTEKPKQHRTLRSEEAMEAEGAARVKAELLDDTSSGLSDDGFSEIKELDAVHIKQELPDAAAALPKPMEGLHEVGPPPFLKKTYEMVDDPDSDPIVSWSPARDSFIVWDSHEFSKIILPKYFKHSNFSSFIRQLNTYGFRKVDSDRWEFANEGFQGGKKHLLKNIRRRSKYNKLHQQGTGFNLMKPGLEDEVEKLRKDQNILKVEILKLRQQQENSHVQLTNVQERIRRTELKQCQMIFFLTRLARRPMFVEQLIQRVKRKRDIEGTDMGKRPRLLGTQCPVTIPNVDYRHQGCDQFATLQSELNGLLSENVDASRMQPPGPSSLDDELCSSVQGLRACGSRAQDVSSAYHVMSEKLLGENSIVEEELDVNDSNIYLELEDLISKPADWVGSASGLMGQTS